MFCSEIFVCSAVPKQQIADGYTVLSVTKLIVNGVFEKPTIFFSNLCVEACVFCPNALQ
jgi:uncharacterized Fe-S radical SAM superfamily protein PflX